MSFFNVSQSLFNQGAAVSVYHRKCTISGWLAVCLIGIAGCATVPKEAVSLSYLKTFLRFSSAISGIYLLFCLDSWTLGAIVHRFYRFLGGVAHARHLVVIEIPIVVRAN
jgi:hypothetical protein